MFLHDLWKNTEMFLHDLWKNTEIFNYVCTAYGK